MLWEDIINKSKSAKVDPKQIFREDMQKTLLTIFSQEGCFEKVVFQGGTALRLFYGNPRFSEDIDLVVRQGGKNININLYSSKSQKLTKNIFPFLQDISYEIQKDTPEIQRFVLETKGINQLQNIRIHVELVNIPSYYNQPRLLEFPPLNPAIRVEEEKEILADKITALGCRAYIKGRDLWDIYFLTEEKNYVIPWDLVKKKVNDYNYSTDEYNKNLKKRNEEIKINGTKILSNELKRFLPPSVYNQYESMFNKILLKVTENIKEKL